MLEVTKPLQIGHDRTCNCPVCQQRSFTSDLKGELTSVCNRQIHTGWVNAVAFPPHGFPTPYKDMIVISFYRKGPVAYLMFSDEEELKRFPALTQYVQNRAVRIEVEGCQHTLTRGGHRRIGKGPLALTLQTRYLNPFIFDLSRADLLSI